MRINVYSQELTPEVLKVTKVSNTGIEYHAVQFVLHSSSMLHHPPADDDRSAVTFWLPKSRRGLNELLDALKKASDIVFEEWGASQADASAKPTGTAQELCPTCGAYKRGEVCDPPANRYPEGVK